MNHDQALHELAAMHGVETTYHDVHGAPHEASSEALLAVLRELEVPVGSIRGASDSVREVRQQRWRNMTEPVAVAWGGAAPEIMVRLADSKASAVARGELWLEEGGRETWEFNLADAPVVQAARVEGVDYSARRLPLPYGVPAGYHQLTVEIGEQHAQVLIIAAPEMAYQGSPRRSWGVFLPLYALRRAAKRRAGNLSDLQDLLRWAAEQGANYVATLPILAGDVSEDPTPYAPSSQCWWNEFYLDPARTAEFSQVPQARALWEDEPGRTPPDRSAAGRVEYERQALTQRAVLDALASSFFAGVSDRRQSFEQFRRRHPDVERYARFRAAQERHGVDWTRWPAELHDRIHARGKINPAAYQRHLYAQWNMQLQIEQLAGWAKSQGMSWYLDLPLGCSRTGYDVWRHQEMFALGAAGGSPPDAFFSAGQNWIFPPLRPERVRQQQYEYFIEVLRRQMQHAQILRLDHAMRFQRIFWIPSGMDARQGVYVRYPADEYFAILTVESQRSGTRLIGENLGTVPRGLNDRLRRHGIDGMYVLQFQVHPDDDPPMAPVPAASAACLNTHDTPPFSAFFAGLDVDDRQDLGLLAQQEALSEHQQRRRLRRRLADYLYREQWLPEWTLDPELMLEALLGFLAASPAGSVTINLEDLWLETRPQNMPGTSTERPNWRRPSKYTLEDIARHPAVLRMLRCVDRLRGGGPS